MVMEIFLGAFIEFLLDRLTPHDFINFARIQGVKKKLKKWAKMLTAIQAVLHDAEEKQLTGEAVNLWLDELRDLAYDVEDILDKFSTELLQRKIKEKHGQITNKVQSLISHVKFNFNMNSEVKEITDRLQEISERKDQLGLKYIEMSTKPWKRPQSSCLLYGPVVGRDEDKRKIVETFCC